VIAAPVRRTARPGAGRHEDPRHRVHPGTAPHRAYACPTPAWIAGDREGLRSATPPRRPSPKTSTGRSSMW
jgi:hypothetical protein